MSQDYNKLKELSKRATIYETINMLAGWDKETYMPSNAIDIRSQQLELLTSHVHKLKTSRLFSKTLEKLIDLSSGKIHDQNLSHVQKATLREWRREYLREAKLPTSFVEKFSKATSIAMHAWQHARQHRNFAEFLPHLKTIVDLCRKQADYFGYQQHPYDALLDVYEPEMTVAQLLPIFARLKTPLIDLLKKIQLCPEPDSSFLRLYYAPEKQLAFGQLILKAMGFKSEESRLDQSIHPMCLGLHPMDTRMTTRVHPDDPMSNILSVIHEGGHGLYNQGLPLEEFGTPLCASISHGFDESQSRLWETIVGRSYPFWEHFFPLMQKEFPENLKGIYLEDFYRAIHRVKPSFIRVEADEVTYNLHIMVRFELELGLIEGSIKAKEIPEAWNEKMRLYLGITPDNDANGCLQDIHWSMGAIAYFPTYTLGNLYAAQLFATYERTHPDWKQQLAQGNLQTLRQWLKEQLHQYGREFTAPEMILRITKEPLTPDHYINYLHKKYKAIYHL